ncbi:MAG: translation initiation factor IF-3 [Verrucomicrobiae bacterium]|nr:translation initiation factor IF-3 [Verrucomicrobiae bacterium]MCX7723453.1 translation initiation factor IF-3 [Verrucomicrobiae bacterium]MDW7979802.1 translation initiation factor IF-3 [Verrucomicrobiales bacterium]
MSSPQTFHSMSGPRVNGKIRAREVRVIDSDGKNLGVFPLQEALAMARSRGLDLVEVAPTATPPVCRILDYGKFRYEQAKREKEARKHQHATKVKEIQLSPKIDPHDLSVKLGHAIDFLCEEMKVKVVLRFRGREMQHTDLGFQVVQKFLAELAPYGKPDSEPKLVGRGITVTVNPLPRNKRAKNPRLAEAEGTAPAPTGPSNPAPQPQTPQARQTVQPSGQAQPGLNQLGPSKSGFVNNPFSGLESQ